MRAFGYLLLALALLVLLLAALSGDAGYVLLHWRTVTIELALSTLLVTGLVVCWGGLQLARLLAWGRRRAGEISTKAADKA